MSSSAEKAENVVSPPQKPVMMSSRHAGEMAGRLAKKAMAVPTI
jgi:hypothetical protein